MQQFLIDANVFVAAIKNPDKKSRTLDLILEIISNDGIKLVEMTCFYWNSRNILKNLDQKQHPICLNS